MVCDRDTCSLEMAKTQSQMLTLGKSLGIYQQEEMSIRRGQRLTGYKLCHTYVIFHFEKLRSGDGCRQRGLRLDGAPDRVL